MKEQPMYKKILVPTDGSRLSQRAVEHAIALAHATGARVVAMHAYPKFPGNPYGTFGPAAEVLAEAHERQVRSEAEALFSRIRHAADAAAVDLETVLTEATDVYRQIIAVARKRKCDLICMASHGRRGVAALVLGSETQKVLTHGTIPVLVLR
jgi:nucleotide-binding universal stress UspA family protein